MRTTATIIAIMLAIGACKKYEDGPLISIKSKKERIANTWVVDKLLKNGIDSTMYFAAPGTVITTEKNGNASGTVVESNGTWSDTTEYTGRWELHEENTVFALILTDIVTNDVDTNWWYITRLKETEMRLHETDDDGDGNYDEQIWLVPK